MDPRRVEKTALLIDQTNLCPCDGEIFLVKAFYAQAEADRLFDNFYRALAWQEESIFIFGKWCKVPRLMCWYGDDEAVYRYSGVTHEPLPWTDELSAVKAQVNTFSGCAFNSVLANLYRDGRDSMGYHADDEKELGITPMIASLSLGEARLFRLHHKKRRDNLDIVLEHGDLLIMGGTLQHRWVHALPKSRHAKNPRINLTFRRILPATQPGSIR